MNEIVTAVTDETPRIWAATIEQVGGLLVVAVQFVVMQHLYATYLQSEPEQSWLMMAWRWYEKQQAYKRAAKWINSEKEIELIGS
jgi:hypothetical protein